MKNNVVWKVLLDFKSTLHLPMGAQFLSAQQQNGTVAAWFFVNVAMPTQERKFILIGTGMTITNDPKVSPLYLATVQMDSLVWHVFEVIKNKEDENK